MASRLVETVMINLDDFADSFLTCGTCFSGYDTQERAAKLLPCSHTICRSCLERILETQTQSGAIRCPICRESVTVPTGGAGAFPPAFIVNQLLDLISTQRRDVVPKCRLHANQELLFCETCDVVFCSECRGRSHSVPSDDDTQLNNHASPTATGSTFNHNVISFNVAIRRCTEIMLHKMDLCVQELEGAESAVSAELERLSLNKSLCVEAINSKFAEIVALVERRQAELLDTVKRLGDEKRRALTDQLALIESEREAVCRECDRLKGILDVRSISKVISYLNDKLDKIGSLTEPRENAFLCYQDHATSSLTAQSCLDPSKSPLSTSDIPTEPAYTGHYVIADTVEPACAAAAAAAAAPPIPSTSSPDHRASMPNSSLLGIARCLASIGTISVSTTYPGLCTLCLPSQFVAYLKTKSLIRTVDYHGRPQLTGGTDPIDIHFTDSDGQSVDTELIDRNDGTYDLILRPVSAGPHQLSVKILSRPIRGSPFQINVRRAQQRIWCFNETSDGRALIQPFAVAYGPYPHSGESDAPEYVYLLDTGNSRLLVLNPESGAIHATLVGSALAGQAATGIAWSPTGLWIVNWRTKSLHLLDPITDKVIQSIHSPQFVEPTSACRCPLTGCLYVADNGASCVFRCDPASGQVQSFIGASVQPEASESDRPTRSGCSTSGPAPSRSTAKVTRRTEMSEPELRSFRRITGLCATPTGEVVISFGSCIRVFSSSGVLLTTLIPPTTAKAVGIGVPPTRTTATLDGTDHIDSIPSKTDRIPNTVSPRGHFGGVFVAQPPRSNSTDMPDRLSVCLLASYSDRKRSGVVVWPAAAAAWSCLPSNTRLAVSNSRSQSAGSLSLVEDRFTAELFPPGAGATCSKPLAPYLIEAEPGLRRLAGLAALSDCRHVVVVDQGGQSLCRLRYA